MAGITSMGIGSGIDVASLVDKLVSSEGQAPKNRLDKREATLQAKISAYGSLKGALSSFQTQVDGLSDPSAFHTIKATSSQSDAVSVTASDTASEGSYDIEVSQLARGQSTASGAFATTGTNVGSGTLTFRFGAVTTDSATGDVTGFSQNADKPVATVDISATDGTLSGIRDAVNKADIGVNASIINDGTGNRLVFSATDSGAENAFTVDVSDSDGNNTDGSGLSQLAFNASATNQQQTRSAQDANLVVNGLSVTRPSNDISNLLDGVSLTLNSTTTGSARIDVSQDVGAVKKKIQSFVDGFNKLQKQIDQIAGYDAEKKQGGILQGDATVRTINSRLRRMVTSVLPVLNGGAVRSLADLGITTDRNGQLTVDSAKLDDALANHFDEVGALFGKTGIVNGSGFGYAGSTDATQPGKYAVNVTTAATRGSVSGGSITAPTASSPLTIDSSNDTLSLTVDGTSSGTISLTQGDYTSGAELATELQAQINGASSLQDAGISVDVAFDNTSNSFTISSSRYGSASSVTVDTGNSSLGLTAGSTDSGVDAQGTINGVTATGEGRSLTAQGGNADGLRINLTSDATGSLGTLTFSHGISDGLSSTLDGYLNSSDGLLDSITSGLKDQVDNIGTERADLQRRLDQIRQRYTKEFNAMDATVAKLNSTSNFLSGQLSGLENLATQAGTKKSSGG
ncbi:MAG TPA: flagellar filament capping protein FliD [Gammaproteobacteria bacterium]|nr:flagellar filament capping protein FliD [Gammaproteobacteria bacterium]